MASRIGLPLVSSSLICQIQGTYWTWLVLVYQNYGWGHLELLLLKEGHQENSPIICANYLRRLTFVHKHGFCCNFFIWIEKLVRTHVVEWLKHLHIKVDQTVGACLCDWFVWTLAIIKVQRAYIHRNFTILVALTRRFLLTLIHIIFKNVAQIPRQHQINLSGSQYILVTDFYMGEKKFTLRIKIK